MNLHTLLLLAPCLLMHLCGAVKGEKTTRAVGWRPTNFSNQCGAIEEYENDGNYPSYPSRICDPDGILERNEKEALFKVIAVIEDTHRLECQHGKNNRNGGAHHGNSIQVAVALVQKMDLRDYLYDDGLTERAARDFALTLHNTWGVGEELSCGGTGILLFLSMDDRAFYISMGGAVRPLLTDRRLAKVRKEMQPLLRRVKYYQALQTAIDAIAIHIESGMPSRMECFWTAVLDNLLAICVVSFILFSIVLGIHREGREREYARVQTQLKELDRKRAEALQGKYQCTSCPICLEDFEWCKSGSSSTEESPLDSPPRGSDGLPLKLLRCGHVFDQSCWAQWVENGRGSLSKCPVCNQDVGGETSTASAAGGGGVAIVEEDLEQQLHHRHENWQPHILAQGTTEAMRQYHQDRIFRLSRMSRQYPNYVDHQQVQLWSDPAYEYSLARDYRFTQRNPSLEGDENNHSRTAPGDRGDSGFCSSGSSMGFGGGTSSGGFGGRW